MNLGVKGEAGERMACDYLKRKGYKVVTRNFYNRLGEIDIICENGEYLVFVEVKLRSAGAHVTGREAVTAAKQRRIIKTAMIFMQSYPTNLQPRFDVIEVSGNQLTHIENAFDGGGMGGYI